MPETGDTAPDFTLARGDGGAITLSALRPGPVVLYFYPRDDTSGCTREALDFSALLPEFRTAGASVVGVSADSAESHARFARKHGLSVTLAADPEAEVARRYGTWVEKKMYGRSFMGIDRTTFLIDGAGTVRQVWRKVRVPGHAEEVLEAVRTL